jgi:hypothetical protein
MLMFLICISRGLAVAAVAVAFVSTRCWRAIVRLKMYTFIVVLSLLWVWAVSIVLSNVKESMIYELAVVRWGRREWHSAGRHSSNAVSRLKLTIVGCVNY